MNKDTLFLLNKDFTDDGAGPFYCPESAFIEGILSYYPELRERLDVRYVDFTKPRGPIVELLGEANQSCPVLILADEKIVPADAATANGRTFISGDRPIARYLADRYGIASIHGEGSCSVTA